MGLFGKNEEPVEPTPPPTRTSTTSKPSIFSRRRSSSPDTRSPVSPARTSTTSSHGLGFLNRNKEDTSITNARERVMSAERAEREADAALVRARNEVKEAREHVKRLEAEAAEDARRAKVKEKAAADISKRANPLGRHG